MPTSEHRMKMEKVQIAAILGCLGEWISQSPFHFEAFKVNAENQKLMLYYLFCIFLTLYQEWAN